MKIQYETISAGCQGQQFSVISGCTRWVRILLFLNISIFVGLALAARFGLLDIMKVFMTFGQVNSELFAKFKIWQLITALFLHGGITHILKNMLALWIFGVQLEKEWGAKNFLLFYFTCGICAGLFSFAVEPFAGIPSIGASGAIFGLIAAFGLIFAEQDIHLIFVALKVKYFVLIYVGLELFLCIMNVQDGIGHWTHLSGFVIGVLYIKISDYFKKRKYGGLFSKTSRRFDNIELD
jgi:membrane associated rhomboid family serine protease